MNTVTKLLHHNAKKMKLGVKWDCRWVTVCNAEANNKGDNKLLLATDNSRMTTWQWAAYKGELDIMLQSWEWAEEKLTTEEIKNKLLFATDGQQMTVWHVAAESGNFRVLSKIWGWAKRN